MSGEFTFKGIIRAPQSRRGRSARYERQRKLETHAGADLPYPVPSHELITTQDGI